MSDETKAEVVQDETVSLAENNGVVTPSNQKGDEVSSTPAEEVLEIDATTFEQELQTAFNPDYKPAKVEDTVESKTEKVEAVAVEEAVAKAPVEEKQSVETEDFTIEGEKIPVPDKNIPLHKLKANKDFLERQKQKIEEKVRKELEEEYKSKLPNEKKDSKDEVVEPEVSDDMEKLISDYAENFSEEGANLIRKIVEKTSMTEKELKAKIQKLEEKQEEELLAAEAEEKALQEAEIKKEINSFQSKYPQAYTDKKWLNEYNPILNDICRNHNMNLNEAIKYAQATNKLPSDEVLIGKVNVKQVEKKEIVQPPTTDSSRLIQNAKDRLSKNPAIEELNLNQSDDNVYEIPQHFDRGVAIDWVARELAAEHQRNLLKKVK